MIEVHLIGYTEDGEQLVFDLDPEGEGRYALSVDPDLLATVSALRDARVAHGRPVDARPTPVPVAAEPAVPAVATVLDEAVPDAVDEAVPEAGPDVVPEAVADIEDRADEPSAVDLVDLTPSVRVRPAPRPGAVVARPAPSPRPAPPPRTTPPSRTTDAPSPGPTATSTAVPSGPTTVDPADGSRSRAARQGADEPDAEDVAVDDPGADPADPGAEPRDDPRDDPRPSARARPRAALSPAEIQRQLRAGRSVTAVAEEAGVEAAWIERWLPPILAERERILRDAWERPVGEGRLPLRTQVEAALADRGAPENRTVWSAARRADGRWRVSVRFPEEGRSRSATWTMRPDGGPLSAASPLAAELCPTAAGRRRR